MKYDWKVMIFPFQWSFICFRSTVPRYLTWRFSWVIPDCTLILWNNSTPQINTPVLKQKSTWYVWLICVNVCIYICFPAFHRSLNFYNPFTNRSFTSILQEWVRAKNTLYRRVSSADVVHKKRVVICGRWQHVFRGVIFWAKTKTQISEIDRWCFIFHVVIF